MHVWVIGGTSGIGKAVADRLVKEGHVIYPSGINEDVREPFDPTDYDKFDWIVYSAGVNRLDWLADVEPDEMLSIFDINVVGLVRILQACPSAWRVVVIGSDAAWRPMRTSLMYNASKAALHEVVRCVARERATESFAINIIAPGLTEGTAMTEYVYERTTELRGNFDLEHYSLDQIPMRRPARPEEIAEVVSKVLSLETTYLNGAIIPVNGAR